MGHGSKLQSKPCDASVRATCEISIFCAGINLNLMSSVTDARYVTVPHLTYHPSALQSHNPVYFHHQHNFQTSTFRTYINIFLPSYSTMSPTPAYARPTRASINRRSRPVASKANQEANARLTRTEKASRDMEALVARWPALVSELNALKQQHPNLRALREKIQELEKTLSQMENIKRILESWGVKVPNLANLEEIIEIQREWEKDWTEVESGANKEVVVLEDEREVKTEGGEEVREVKEGVKEDLVLERSVGDGSMQLIGHIAYHLNL